MFISGFTKLNVVYLLYLCVVATGITYTTYSGIAAGSFFFGKGIKFWDRTTRKTLKYLETEVEDLRSELATERETTAKTRHDLRGYIKRFDALLIVNQIYMRYLTENGITIRSEDQNIIDLAVLVADSKPL